MSKEFTGDLELFKEFIAFCESQPADTNINHDTWSSCAVGEFYKETGRYVDDLEIGYQARDLLGTDIVTLIGNAQCPSFYGEFTEFLKSYLPEETV